MALRNSFLNLIPEFIFKQNLRPKRPSPLQPCCHCGFDENYCFLQGFNYLGREEVGGP